MLLAQILVLCLLTIILISVYLYYKYAKKRSVGNKLLKIFSLILMSVFVVRYMSGDEAIRNVVGLVGAPLYKQELNALATIFIWLTYFNVIVVTLYPFFKIKTIQNIIKYITLPTSVVCAIILSIVTKGVVGENVYTSAFNFGSVRAILMAIELAILISYSFVVFYESNTFKITWKEVGLMALCTIPMLLVCMPAYTLQAFFTEYPRYMKLDGFTLYHRLFLYVGFILPVVMYFVLRNKDYKIKKFTLLFWALGALLVFSQTRKYDSFLDVTRWPLHLCNTAMYIVVVCLVFKWEKLFYFTYFINVLGAFFAMTIPGYSTLSNLFTPDIWIFWTNHWIAFFMPLLMVGLGLYPRPKLKQFIYSVVAFSIYFALIIVVNAWFTNYGKVDFFFVNSDYITDKLGQWANNLRNITWTFYIGNLKFVLYPLYQFLFWLVYMFLSLGMWFIYDNAFALTAQFADIRLRKKLMIQQKMELIQILDGRGLDEPMDLDTVNQLVLKDFSKRYGASNVYAVKDANLVVNGGEVFGFLGPNGAGKSTIIKSIVGIQPITSGHIEVCGYDVEKQPLMSKKQIGFVPDHYALYEKLTGREYVNYIADLYNVNKLNRDERIEKYVKLFELEGSFDNQIKTYSHGMKQKITIMSALVHSPRIWILDEPLTGLDPNSIYQVKECMKQHAKEGNIVFFSSHIIDVVEKICDKIAIIKNGHIICTKTMEEIEKNEGGLEHFYLNTIEKTNVDREVLESRNKKVNKPLKDKDKDNDTIQVENKDNTIKLANAKTSKRTRKAVSKTKKQNSKSTK